MLTMNAGAGLSSVFSLLQGCKTRRNAGSEAAERVIRTLDNEPEESCHVTIWSCFCCCPGEPARIFFGGR